MKYPDDFLNKILCGDSLPLMKLIPDNAIDLILCDPPYGIGADKGVGGFGSSQHTAKKYKDNWDNIRPSQEIFNEILRVSKNVIIFGGNFFADLLPVNGHWIVWDKKGEIKFDNPFGDAELAWTNIDKKSVKKYTVIQQGFVSKEKIRYHPTQKPVELFGKILRDYSKSNDIILDPFLGSGTTCVAAKELGRRYIGIEISQKYVDIANKRLSQGVLPF